MNNDNDIDDRVADVLHRIAVAHVPTDQHFSSAEDGGFEGPKLPLRGTHEKKTISPLRARSGRRAAILGAAAAVALGVAGLAVVSSRPDPTTRTSQSSPLPSDTGNVPTSAGEQSDEVVVAAPQSGTTSPPETAPLPVDVAPTVSVTPSVVPLSDALGQLIDVDEMTQAIDMLQLPSDDFDLTLAFEDGLSMAVELSSGPNQTGELVCVVQYDTGRQTGSACGDPSEVGGLLAFGYRGRASVLSNIDQPIEFAATSCRVQWAAEAEPFKLQVCEPADEIATVNGLDRDGNPAHFELWVGPLDGQFDLPVDE